MFKYLLCIAVEMAVFVVVYRKGNLGISKKENEKEQRFAVFPPSTRIRKNSALWTASWAAFAFGSAFMQSSFGSRGSIFPALGIVMAAAGIVVCVWSYRWHVVVGNDYLIAYRLFGGETVARLSDIQKTGESGGEIHLSGSGGVIAVINERCGNYNRFCEKTGQVMTAAPHGAEAEKKTERARAQVI